VCGRPTKSRSLYCQMVGRGTRPLAGIVDQHDTAEGRRAAIAASTKPHTLILDFVGNSGHHKLISTADILGGKYDGDVVEWATKAVRDGRGDADMSEALKKAKAARDEEDRKAEERRRQAVKARARFATERVAPFGQDRFAAKTANPPRHWFVRKATEKQRALLARYGLGGNETTVAEASRMIDAIAANNWRVPDSLKHLRNARAS